MRKRPASVDIAAWLLWILVAAGLVVTVLVVLLREELMEAWSPDPLGDSTVQPLDFVPVVVVLYAVVAILTLTLVPLMRHRHNWARHSLAGIALGILVTSVATVRTMPPPLFRGVVIGAAVVSAVTLVFLWHPDTRRYLREGDADLDPAIDRDELEDREHQARSDS